MERPRLEEEDFPGLYHASDELSNSTQRKYLLLVKGFLVLLVAAAVISIFSFEIVALKLVSALVYLLVLVLTVATYLTNLNKRWYNARAIAESVKTMTWRFVMCADPYPSSLRDPELTQAFVDDLKLMFNQNRDIARYLSGTHIGKENVTQAMRRIRRLSFKVRLGLYIKERIDNQLDWYKRRTVFNTTRSGRWFGALVGLLSIAVAAILVGLVLSSTISLISQVANTAVACSLTWIQIKRYAELSAAFNLTANEIGFIKSLSGKVQSDSDLNRYVRDAENAFSREHTQLVARRDQ